MIVQQLRSATRPAELDRLSGPDRPQRHPVIVGPAELLNRIWNVGLRTGATLGPIDAWPVTYKVDMFSYGGPATAARSWCTSFAVISAPTRAAVWTTVRR
ncbi:hypothetical protein ABZ619_38070 [Streptomyces sp. NPDC007851]|uniref:hypothetical protein n=1 Tax=Streptomyces sp. NPDC007851 TaxID=3155008 RepID=UPI0033E320FF